MRSREDVLRDSKLGILDRSHRTSRREFIQVSLAAGGAVVVGWTTRGSAAQGSESFHPNPYVRVDPDDTVTIWSAQPDMGEGTKTSLTMLLVEELDADWNRVRIELAPLDRKYGGQGVGGSDAIRYDWDRLRPLGATARLLLVRAAAQRWQVPESEISAARGVLEHPASKRRATFGELASSAAKLPVPKEPAPTKAHSQYRLIGKRVPNVDNGAITRGERLFGLDVKLPGMKYAAIAKCPVFAGRPIRVDAAAALKIPGVRQVVEVHGLDNPTHLMSGVAVVADNTWAAFNGRKALAVDWAEGEFAQESSATLEEQARSLLEKPSATLYDSGGVDEALTGATLRIDNTFSCGFVSHATLEPHNCTADYRDGQVWIHGPLQMPGSGRQVVARALGIPPERVHVQSTRIGGGFGRRLLSDYAAEAAVVSRAIGTPVQVVDDRTGDLQHDYYRPLAVQRLRASLDSQRRIACWDHVIVSASRNAYRRDARPPHSTEVYGSYVGRVTAVEQLDPDLVPTRIPQARLRYAPIRTGVATGAWRAPSHVAIAFAIESTIDELAVLAHRSAIDLRLEMLGEPADVPKAPDQPTPYDPSRMARVIQAAAERGGFGARPPEGRARGFAAHYTFGSYCAQVAEVSVNERRQVVVHRVVAVADAGQPVNLSGFEAQVEGAVIDGIGAGFFGDVPIERGRATPENFDRYRLIRNREAPAAIDVTILPSTVRPTGMGEIGIPPIAPAVANAIAALTGQRIRRMPFAQEGYDLTASRP
jgi:isoquinoline 1-oxidoreductase beta subunit